jgi:hypothetical protein
MLSLVYNRILYTVHQAYVGGGGADKVLGRYSNKKRQKVLFSSLCKNALNIYTFECDVFCVKMILRTRHNVYSTILYTITLLENYSDCVARCSLFKTGRKYDKI